MDYFLFFVLSIILGYVWFKSPIWSVMSYKVVIWPCISAFGIWAVFTYRFFDGTITQGIYWTFFWTFFWSFWAIFGFAQLYNIKKKPNELDQITQAIKRLEKLIPQKDLIWIGFKRISRLLHY